MAFLVFNFVGGAFEVDPQWVMGYPHGKLPDPESAMIRAVALAFLVVLAVPGTGVASEAAKVRHFENKVRPLLVRYCAECHDSEEPESDLVLTTVDGIRSGGRTGAVLVPGDAAASRLTEAVRYTTKLRMPPDRKLPQRVIDELVQWVDQGAVMPKGAAVIGGKASAGAETANRADASHWSFQPIQDPLPPRIANGDRVNNEIDRFIRAKLAASGIDPNWRADRRTLIRRLTFNLIGLPPTPAEVKRFVADPAPNAYADLVDRLLASPHYGERWGRHWLDVARYADSNGGGFDYIYPNAFHYRDYVVRALNEDKPYDRFVVEQLAGDRLPMGDDPDSYVERLKATGFLTVAPKGIGMMDKQQMIMDVVDDQIDVVGRTLMGLTLACARCHDHKFDPIPTTDYYALAGIFRSTELISDTDKNPSYWPERPLDHPRVREQRLLWEKRRTDNAEAIADLKFQTAASLFGADQIPPPIAH